jgi:hypothetical protein
MNKVASVLETFKVGERNFWIAIIAVVVALFLGFVVFPWWYDMYYGAASNETAAVLSLRKIDALETLYAAAHADKGFACDFSLLRATEQASDPKDATEALSGDFHGYAFTLSGCTPQVNRIATHYQVTAVPTKPGSTGVHAFCTDQTSQLFYDEEGSPSQCLDARRLVPERWTLNKR